MLIEFSVENFRSIKDRITLSLVAANLRSRDPSLDAETEIKVNEKLSLLRSAIVYGANGSGKTNIFKALHFMRRFIGDSAREGQSGDPIPVEPFLLNPNTPSKPSTFEAVMLIDGVQHRYGFSVDSTRVVEEWLYYTPTTREAELFTRDEDGIHVSSRFRGGRGLIHQTRDNALFLSVASQFNTLTAMQVRRWFIQICQILTTEHDAGYLPYTMRCIDDGTYRSQIQSLVRRLDLDITDISVADLPLLAPESGATMAPFESVSSDGANKSNLPVNRLARMETRKELRSLHSVRDDGGKIIGELGFPIRKMESEGTQKLIALAGPIIDTLANGRVLFVDEIDARLHPLITAALLRLFNSTETNPKNAQLVCATHDTNLLDRRNYRRDQIYFVEKDRSAATKLFSLADFKLELPIGGSRTVRNDASFEHDYIQGRYGAIPYIGDLHQLFVEELQHDDPTEERQGRPEEIGAR